MPEQKKKTHSPKSKKKTSGKEKNTSDIFNIYGINTSSTSSTSSQHHQHPFDNNIFGINTHHPSDSIPSTWEKSQYTIDLRPNHMEYHEFGPGQIVVNEYHERHTPKWWEKILFGNKAKSKLQRRTSTYVPRFKTVQNEIQEQAWREFVLELTKKRLSMHGSLGALPYYHRVAPRNVTDDNKII